MPGQWFKEILLICVAMELLLYSMSDMKLLSGKIRKMKLWLLWSGSTVGSCQWTHDPLNLALLSVKRWASQTLLRQIKPSGIPVSEMLEASIPQRQIVDFLLGFLHARLPCSPTSSPHKRLNLASPTTTNGCSYLINAQSSSSGSIVGGGGSPCLNSAKQFEYVMCHPRYNHQILFSD